jgi:hypothetical protein
MAVEEEPGEIPMFAHFYERGMELPASDFVRNQMLIA